MNFYVLTVDETTKDYIHRIYLAGVAGEIPLDDIYVSSLDEEVKSDNVVFRNEEGVDFLAGILIGATAEDAETDDQLIPSHEAPHVLAHVMMRLLDIEGYKCKLVDLVGRIGTPYEYKLKKGLKVLSFSTDICPLDCLEEGDCPLDGAPITWDVGGRVRAYMESEEPGTLNLNFSCNHYLRQISTIPMKNIIKGWLKLKEVLAEKRGAKFAVTTHSRCHGIVALIEAVEKKSIFKKNR